VQCGKTKTKYVQACERLPNFHKLPFQKLVGESKSLVRDADQSLSSL
jgi:hypothetical protein